MKENLSRRVFLQTATTGGIFGGLKLPANEKGPESDIEFRDLSKNAKVTMARLKSLGYKIIPEKHLIKWDSWKKDYYDEYGDEEESLHPKKIEKKIHKLEPPEKVKDFLNTIIRELCYFLIAETKELTLTLGIHALKKREYFSEKFLENTQVPAYLDGDKSSLGTLRFSPFFLQTEYKKEKINIIIRNILDPNLKPLTSLNFILPKNSDETIKMPPQTELKLILIAKKIAEEMNTVQQQIDSIKPEKQEGNFGKPIVSVIHNTPEEKKRIKKTTDLLKQYPSFEIRIYAHPTTLRKNDMSFLISEHLKLPALDKCPVLIDGQIYIINLNNTRPTIKSDKATNIEYLDFHGNVILYELSLDSKKHTTTETIYIVPALLLRQEKSEPAIRPLQIDLTKIGGDNVNLSIYRKADELKAELGEQKQYKCFAPKETKIEKKSIEHMAMGVKEAETLFGLPSGSVINTLHVNLNEERNVFFMKYRPNTILINIGYLQTIPRASPGFLDPAITLQSTGRHETFHAIDHKFKIVNGEIFKSLYNYIAQYEQPAGQPKKGFKFSQMLDEGSLIPGIYKRAGHSFSDEQELLASLLNSFSHHLWKEVLSIKDTEFLTKYLHCLEVLELRLKEIPEISKDAPIFVKIKEVMDFVELKLK